MLCDVRRRVSRIALREYFGCALVCKRESLLVPILSIISVLTVCLQAQARVAILASENACDGRCRDEEAPDLNVNLECLPECEFPWCFDHFFNRGVMLFSMGVSPAAVLGRATRLGAAWGTGRGGGGLSASGRCEFKARGERNLAAAQSAGLQNKGQSLDTQDGQKARICTQQGGLRF